MITMSIHFFFFNDTATTEIYTLSLHDALPIYGVGRVRGLDVHPERREGGVVLARRQQLLELPEPLVEILGERLDRKSTRLNSSHANISYAVFCLKKKKKLITAHLTTTVVSRTT